MARLRDDHVLELRLIRAKRIHAGDALYSGVRLFEDFVGRAQKAGYIEGGGIHHHAAAWTVRADRFAALSMIDAAAGEVAADRHAKNHRRFEGAVRTPAHHAKLVANLHHGRPDVVEELNFGNGL